MSTQTELTPTRTRTVGSEGGALLLILTIVALAIVGLFAMGV